MALSTAWADGTTFFAADLNDLTHFTYNRSSSDHLHSGTYAPVFSTADYAVTIHTHNYAPITGSTVYVIGVSSDYAPVFSTSDYAITAHLHTTVYSPFVGSTVYITGTSTDLGIVSNPPTGYKRITNLYVNENGQLITVYDT